MKINRQIYGALPETPEHELYKNKEKTSMDTRIMPVIPKIPETDN